MVSKWHIHNGGTLVVSKDHIHKGENSRSEQGAHIGVQCGVFGGGACGLYCTMHGEILLVSKGHTLYTTGEIRQVSEGTNTH